MGLERVCRVGFGGLGGFGLGLGGFFLKPFSKPRGAP